MQLPLTPCLGRTGQGRGRGQGEAQEDQEGEGGQPRVGARQQAEAHLDAQPGGGHPGVRTAWPPPGRPAWLRLSHATCLCAHGAPAWRI